MLEKLPDVLGHALRGQRAGLENTAFRLIDLRQGMGAIEAKSLAFVDHAPIPARYTADGEGLSPPLQWVGVPAAASSVVLMVEDADAPTAACRPAATRICRRAGCPPTRRRAMACTAMRSSCSRSAPAHRRSRRRRVATRCSRRCAITRSRAVA